MDKPISRLVTYTSELKEKLITCGACNYSLKKILLVLTEEEAALVEKDWHVPDSQAKVYYNKGKARADYLIDKKLLQLAQSGDLNAIKLLEDRRLPKL